MLTLLLTLACHLDENSVCVVTDRVVGDDEVLGDLEITAAELAAEAVGTHAFTASSGRYAGAGTLTLARGAGDVIFHDAAWETVKEWEPGFFEDDTLMYFACDDDVSVPMDAIVATDDGAFAVAGPGVGSTFRGGELVVRSDTLTDASGGAHTLYAAFFDAALTGLRVADASTGETELEIAP